MIPTIEEISKTIYQPIGMTCNEFAIELAKKVSKLHVEAALKAASEKADAKSDKTSGLSVSKGNLYWTFAGNIGNVVINKESILSADSLENIK